MITIHEKTAKTFDTFGLGALVPSHCVVEEELNGAYELELKHPYADPRQEGCSRSVFIMSNQP